MMSPSPSATPKRTSPSLATKIPQRNTLGIKASSGAHRLVKANATRKYKGSAVSFMCEDDLQAQIVDYLRLLLPACYRVLSIPNGGRRSLSDAGIKKRTGLSAGVPDLAIVGPGGLTFWLECKTARGRLSPAQNEWFRFLQDNDAPVAVVRSLEDVRASLETWDIPFAKHELKAGRLADDLARDAEPVSLDCR